MAHRIGTSVQCIGCGLVSFRALPPEIIAGAKDVSEINATDNSISSFDGLEPFAGSLQTLILDSNCISSLDSLPIMMPKLKTLWLNKNAIVGDVQLAFGTLASKCPCLDYLSLMFNPCCPHELTGHTEQEYRRYRVLIKFLVPTVKILDSAVVTEEEADQAATRGRFLVTRCAPLPDAPAAVIESKAAPTSAGRTSFLGSAIVAEKPSGEVAAPVFAEQTRFYKASDGNRYIGNADL